MPDKLPSTGQATQSYHRGYGPQIIAITGSGELVVSEYHNISREGQIISSIYTTSVKSGSNWYRLELMGIVVSDDGSIHVTGGHRLLKLNADGKLVKSVGGS